MQCQTPMPHEVLRPRLARAVASGELRTALGLVASAFFSLVFGHLTHAHHGDRVVPPVAKVATGLVEVLLDGAGA